MVTVIDCFVILKTLYDVRCSITFFKINSEEDQLTATVFVSKNF